MKLFGVLVFVISLAAAAGLAVAPMGCGGGSTTQGVYISTEYCAPGCHNSWIGDGECDDACRTAECNWDGGDCAWVDACAVGCPDEWIGDGVCDDACYNAVCGWDGGDCDIPECDDGYSISVNDPSMCCPYGYPYYWPSDGMCHTGLPAAPTITPTRTPNPTPTPTPVPACRQGYSQAVNDPSMCCADGYPYYWDSDGMCHTVAPPAWREDIRSGDLVLDPAGAMYWGHIGICYGTDYVIEAKNSGVTKSPIAEWDDKPGVYVLRVDCSDYTAAQAADLALGQVGKPYDYFFAIQRSADLNSEYWYCSELVWAVYMNLGINLEYTPDDGGPVTPWEVYMSTQIIYHAGPPDIIPDSN
jgi:hypothetical protein